MSALLDPVGPLPPAVYWRRRAVVAVVLLLVVFVAVRACAGDGGGDGAAAGAASTDQATETGEARSRVSSSAKATASRTSTSTTPPRCSDDEVEVTARPSESGLGVGAAVPIRFEVKVTGDRSCRRDVGAAANEVRVLKGGELVWSSDHCNPGGASDVRTLGPDSPYSVLVQWDGTVTPEGCPETRSDAGAGRYEVVGRNGDVVGPGAPLTLG